MENQPHEYKEKAGKCKECGNSPVNHAFMYISSTGQVWLGELWYRLVGTKGFPKSVRRGKNWIETMLQANNFRFFHRLGMIRYAHDVTKARSYRSQVVWEEAQRRGIPMEQAVFLGQYSDAYRAKVNGRWIYFESLPISPEIPQDAYLWIDDKFLLKKVLAAAGVTVPKSLSVVNEVQVRMALQKIGAPVVVKPRSGSRGRHTTTNVHTEEDLLRAFRSAKKLGRHVSIEKFLRGSVCRATVVGGKLVGFFQADPPRVTGDGESAIRGLVTKRNTEKPDRVQDIALTDEHGEFLRRQNLTPDSILEKGRTVDLSHRTGRLFGGETRELLDTVHPKLRAQAERAATVLNVPVVGFDLMIKDPEADPDTQEWGIIEANSLPFIDLHYLPLYGKPSNPAAAVWDLWGKDRN